MKVCPQCGGEYPGEVDFCPQDGMKLRARRTESEDPLIGRALDGRWVIEEKLGEGGMGAVYKGHQQSVSRTVAIKTLRPQLVESEEFVDRFFREAKIAASISHPHCVTILDYGESEDGTLYLAMEFLEGELLTDRIETGTVTARQVVEIGVQVASALSAAHDQNIVHRDLKPDNIFLLDVPGGGIFAKVLDFGIAKMLDSNTQVTKTGMIFGTPEYMSPEQCRGGQLDGRSDLYSLGCILYELVGGSTPFRATTPMAVLMAHVNEDAQPLRGGPLQANIPDSLDRVIMRLLSKLPERRYASANELRQALQAVLNGVDDLSGSVNAAPQLVGDEVQLGFSDTMAIADGSVEQRSVSPDTAKSSTAASSNTKLLAIAAALVAAIFVVGGLAWAFVLGPQTDPSAADVATAEANEPAPVAMDEQPPTPVVAEADDAAGLAAKDDVPDAGTAIEKPTTQEPDEPAAVADARPKKRRRTRPAPKAEEPVTDELDLDIDSLAKDVDTSGPVPTPEPSPGVDSSPEPEKPKKKKNAVRKINEAAEKVTKDVGKKTKRELEKAFDGLMGE